MNFQQFQTQDQPYNLFNEDYKNNNQNQDIIPQQQQLNINLSQQQLQIIDQLENIGISKKNSIFVILTHQASTFQQVLNFITTNDVGRYRHFYLSDHTDADLCLICGSHKSLHQPINENNNSPYKTEKQMEELYYQICKYVDPAYQKSQFNIDMEQFQNNAAEKTQCTVCKLQFKPQFIAIFYNQGHDICIECFKNYLKTQIEIKKISIIKCTHCQSLISDDIIYQFCQPEVQKNYIELKDKQQNLIIIICPVCQIDNHVESAELDIIQCVNCQTKICAKCHVAYRLNHKCDAMIQIENNLHHNLLERCPQCNSYARKQKFDTKLQVCAVCSYRWCKVCRDTYTIFHDNKYKMHNLYCLPCSNNREKKCKVIAYRLGMIFLFITIIMPLFLAFGGFYISFKKNRHHFDDKMLTAKNCILAFVFFIQGFIIDGLLMICLIPAIIWVIYKHYSQVDEIMLVSKNNIKKLEQGN